MHQRNRPRHLFNQSPGWILWGQWVLSTALAELVGINIVAVASSAIGFLDNVSLFGILLTIGVLEGVVLGVAQWLVLRHYINKAIWWVLATTLGVILAWGMGLAISVLMALIYANKTDPASYEGMLTGVVLLGVGVGLVIGSAQWLVLKNHLRNAGGWISSNAFAWALGLLVAFMGAGMVKSEDLTIGTALTQAATGVTMGVVIGAITGIVLVKLLKPPIRAKSIQRRWKYHSSAVSRSYADGIRKRLRGSDRSRTKLKLKTSRQHR